MFHAFYRNNDPLTARPLAQLQDSRYLIQNPPPPTPSSPELDQVQGLDYEREVHPYYARLGGGKGPGDHPLCPHHPPRLLRGV